MRGIRGGIRSIVGLIIGGALFIAILSQFNWDIIELASWCIHGIWSAMVRLAQYISGMSAFREIFSWH